MLGAARLPSFLRIMSYRTSCVEHPPGQRYIHVEEWQIEAAGGACGAILLSLLEGWHNSRIAQSKKAELENEIEHLSGGNGEQRTGNWVCHRDEDLCRETLHFYSPKSIREALKSLAAKEFIKIGGNPNPRMAFDKSRWILFQPEKVQEWIEGWKKRLDPSGKIPASSGKIPVSTNCTGTYKGTDQAEGSVPAKEEDSKRTIGILRQSYREAKGNPLQYVKGTDERGVKALLDQGFTAEAIAQTGSQLWEMADGACWWAGRVNSIGRLVKNFAEIKADIERTKNGTNTSGPGSNRPNPRNAGMEEIAKRQSITLPEILRKRNEKAAAERLAREMAEAGQPPSENSGNGGPGAGMVRSVVPVHPVQQCACAGGGHQLRKDDNGQGDQPVLFGRGNEGF